MTGDASPAALIKATTARELVAVYQGAVADIRAAFATVHAAQTRLTAAFSVGGTRAMPVGDHRHDMPWSDPEPIIEELNRRAWEAVVERLELKRMMSTTRWEELEARLQKPRDRSYQWSDVEPLPALTEGALLEFVRRHANDMPTLFHEAVLEVYEWLRVDGAREKPHYRTNEKGARLEIGERVHLTNMVRGRGDRWEVLSGNYSGNASQRLTALENVFTGLDGAGTSTRGYYSAIEMAIRGAVGGHAETPYFEARVYKNGNVALRFKRLDLLARFNQIAGGARLRPGTE